MAQAAGALLGIAGGITGGIAAKQNRQAYERMMGQLPKPDVAAEEANYFNDFGRFLPQANRLSTQAREQELAQSLALRESAMPGIGAGIRNAASSISDLLSGHPPQGVMDAYMRAGGASVVGGGWGGSQFGALNTGLFGARGALGAIQTGMGLLPTLLGSLPNISAPTSSQLLKMLLSPEQRIGLTMQLRQQQIGMNNSLAEMPTALDAWSAHLNRSSAVLLGAGSGGNYADSMPKFSGSGDAESNPSSWGSYSGIGTIQPKGGNLGTGE